MGNNKTERLSTISNEVCVGCGIEIESEYFKGDKPTVRCEQCYSTSSLCNLCKCESCSDCYNASNFSLADDVIFTQNQQAKSL